MVRDKKIIVELNKPLALIPAPFKAAAARLGMSERGVVARIRRYQRSGLIRRYGAMLSHRRIGLTTNALVAWSVPARDAVRIGKILARYPEVSHCYQRRTNAGWPYTLYTMLHCRGRQDCLRLVRRIARRTGIPHYVILFTLKEFKKAKADLGKVLA